MSIEAFIGDEDPRSFTSFVMSIMVGLPANIRQQNNIAGVCISRSPAQEYKFLKDPL